MKSAKQTLTYVAALVCCLSVTPCGAQAVKPQGDALENALRQLERAHLRHIEVLADLLDKVPNAAKPGLRRAIEASQKGLLNARQALAQNNQRVRKGKPQGVGKGKGKPQGVGKGKGKPQGVGKGKGKPQGVGKGKGKPRGVGKGKGKPPGVGKGKGKR